MCYSTSGTKNGYAYSFMQAQQNCWWQSYAVSSTVVVNVQLTCWIIWNFSSYAKVQIIRSCKTYLWFARCMQTKQNVKHYELNMNCLIVEHKSEQVPDVQRSLRSLNSVAQIIQLTLMISKPSKVQGFGHHRGTPLPVNWCLSICAVWIIRPTTNENETVIIHILR